VKDFSQLFCSLGSSLDLDETLGEFDRQLGRLIDYAAISVHIVEEEGNMSLAFVSGPDFRSLSSHEGHLGDGPIGVAASDRRPLLNCCVGGLHIAMVIPAECRGRVTAVVALYRRAETPFSESDLDGMLAVRSKLAVSIENARRYQMARRLSGLDQATGALNTRAMFRQLDAGVARARRNGEVLAVVDCAIDGIDESQPDLSRRVYREIARTLIRCCREYDWLARAGDRFVLLLAGLGASDFPEKSAQIQAEVAAVGMRAGLPLSARLGAAFYPAGGSDAEGLLASAAEELRAGR